MPVVLVAVPADAIIALAVLLFLYAFRAVIVKSFAWVLEQIPVVGGNLSGALNAGANTVVGWAEDWAKFGINALVQLVSIPVNAVAAVVGGAVNLAEGIAANLATLFASAADLAGRLLAAVGLLYSQALAIAASVAHLAESIPGTVADVARSLIAAAVDAVRTQIAQDVAALRSLIGAAEAAIGAVEARITAMVAAAVAGLTASLTAAVAQLGLQLGHDVQAIDGELSTLAGELSQLAALLPLIGVVPIVLDLTEIAEDCIIPNCKVQGPQLGVLQDLMAMATLLAVGELVGEAVRDPHAAAVEVGGLVGGIEGAARDLFGTFAGVSL